MSNNHGKIFIRNCHIVLCNVLCLNLMTSGCVYLLWFLWARSRPATNMLRLWHCLLLHCRVLYKFPKNTDNLRGEWSLIPDSGHRHSSWELTSNWQGTAKTPFPQQQPTPCVYLPTMYHNNPSAAADKLLETRIRGKAETSCAQPCNSNTPHFITATCSTIVRSKPTFFFLPHHNFLLTKKFNLR